MYTKENPRTSREHPEIKLPYENTHASFLKGGSFPEKKLNRLPAMGWNSWNAFGTGNTAALTKIMADKFIELGLDKLGYKYLVLDDGCYLSERINGRLSNEPVKFPEGFKSLADYIHAKGLKFGMYNDIGTNLCAGSAVGTCGFEDLDAQSYADWDVDFLKVDNCYYLWDNATFSNGENAKYSYAPNIKSIKLTDENNVFSIELSAVNDGFLSGLKAEKKEDFVTNIGTFDGTNTGTTPVGPRYGELCFKVMVPETGAYLLNVVYASGKEEGCGQWLQVVTNDNREFAYDDLLPETVDKENFVESAVISITLNKGENVIKLMNHRRQENVLASYGAMFYGLKKANPEKDVVLSICEWGKTHPQNWGYKVGDSWRILNDITFCVGSDGNPGTQSIASQYNKAVVMDEFSGLDKGWNDPDMMVIGMDGISIIMSKTHMTMWCMMNSPLMLGMDLRRIKKGDELYNIIANKDLIDLNQDSLGIQAKRVWSSLESESPDLTYITNNDRADILVKPLSNGDIAISFVNLSDNCSEPMKIYVQTILKFLSKKIVNVDRFADAERFVVKNLWDKSVHEIEGAVFECPKLNPYDNYTIRVSVK